MAGTARRLVLLVLMCVNIVYGDDNTRTARSPRVEGSYIQAKAGSYKIPQQSIGGIYRHRGGFDGNGLSPRAYAPGGYGGSGYEDGGGYDREHRSAIASGASFDSKPMLRYKPGYRELGGNGGLGGGGISMAKSRSMNRGAPGSNSQAFMN